VGTQDSTTTKKQEEILRLVRLQCLDNSRPAQYYLALIKTIVLKSKWKKYLEELIVDIEQCGQQSNHLLEEF